MEVEAAKVLGAGLAVMGVFGAGIGIGNVFSSSISSIARNPSAKKEIFNMTIIGAALTEAIAIFAIVVAFVILTK
ncbi:F0F1 ATP synthase subunit C [Candidatus Nucleicultrix amoebiphila]|jgi:F-type H+-transporting ATPase subunit c|uniref:ATP synthase subunit c n=1 Tax=Candidatus Nucleicultrix amoebiphila FS5 TaxID=1414854 RepID=A0A1W6N3F2_9PROT|nr:F0F1 ATP synthase subunit C [Candidatus Nucleicultrix amoebiphila]ARN84352.1 ATP synthase subunit C [Candidatus Nucleicultrix amoebiphila FS5]